MGLMEKISENLDCAEEKRNNLRRSVFMLMSDWREFEKNLEGTHKYFQECFLELESREKELKLERKSVDERFREVQDKEKGLFLLQDKGLMELGLKEKEWDLNRGKLVLEIEVKEKKLNAKEILINGLFEKLEVEKNELVAVEKLLEERLREVGLKEECIEERRKEIELTQDGVVKRVFELDHREKKVMERENRIDFKDSLRSEREREIEIKEKEASLVREDLSLKEKESDIVRSLNDKREKELDMREKQLEVKKKAFVITQECMKDIHLKKKEFLVEKELLDRGNKELVVKWKELENRIKGLKDFEVKEKQLEAKRKELEAAQERLKKCQLEKRQWEFEKELLEEENKELGAKRKELEDRIKGLEKLELEEKQLETKRKELEVAQESLKECHLKMNQFELEKELLEKGNKELELKRKEFEARIKGLEKLKVEEKQLEAKRKELEVAQESLKECQLKTNQFQLEKELLEKGNKELELKRKEFETKIKGLQKLEVEEMQLETKRKELEVVQESLKLLQLKTMQFQLEKELLEKGNKELELKRKEFQARIKAFEMREKEFIVKEKKLNDTVLAREPVKKEVDESLNTRSSSPHFRFAVELDGLDVHMSINGRKIDLSSKDEVFKALQLSGDPVYFVLTAIETLYPPYLRKVDMEFEGNVARSCIVLLEQLIIVSPKIRSCERDEAIKLAGEWKAIINTGNSLEVLGFLYLLASFDLASAFDADEVMKFLEAIAEHQQMPKLCRRLGLTDKISGLIQNLLKSKRSLQAIGLIYAFELVDHFPPVPILKTYLKHVKKVANTMSKMLRTTEAQNEAIDEKVAAMKAVIRCIVDHKLEAQYPPKILETSIRQFLMQKVHEKCSETVVHHNAQDQKEVEGMEISSTTGSDGSYEAQNQQEFEEKDIPSTTSPNCLKGCKVSPEFSNTDICPRDAMSLILAIMNGKSLLSFLDSHLVENKFLHNEVCTALQISDDSAKLVLDAVEGFYSSELQEQESRCCVFLLEQLMRLSPHIAVDVKEIAQRIAFDWKAKIRTEIASPSVVLVFLLFISTFGLVSAFDADELLQLYKIVLKHKSVPGLHQALGISEMISESQQLSSEDLELKVESASSTTVLAIDAKSLCNNVSAEVKEHVLCCNQIPRFIQNSSNPAHLVLDALDFSYFSCSQKNKISQLVYKSFFYLLKQLASVSPDIKLRVKERAYNLALGWKSKLTGSNSWEVLAFLQLLAIYGLSSSFNVNYLLGLLEVPSQLKEASNLFRILGLEDKVPGFVMDLVKKKQHLLAFEYVYEFNLVDKIPPVALLKRHALCAKLAAKEICNDRQATPEAQDGSIVYEIYALKSVIKCILDHSLQSEYSPDELRKRVAQLEILRANMNTSMLPQVFEEPPKSDAYKEPLVVPKTQSEHQDRRKRPASGNAITNKAQLPLLKKSRRFATPPAEAGSNLELSNGQFSHSVQPSSYHPDGLHTERHVSQVPRHYYLGGSNGTMQQTQLGLDVSRNIVHSGFPSYHFGLASTPYPPPPPPPFW